ncbi:hypothetical protein DL766_009291 [Monosporascus sp. MC13-8B]|nr:hypothetical protein DL766_009291 [Monosporascus sp. MC13-8B]
MLRLQITCYLMNVKMGLSVLQTILLFLVTLGISNVLALTPPPPLPPPDEVDENVTAALADVSQPETGIAYFEQYIDHENPGFGTFSQTYWYNATYWKGPGSPIILFTPGEVAAAGYTGYLTDAAITGLIAKEVGGAVLLVEHRYWGNSTPYVEQTTKNLRFLNLDQSVADFVHFARTAKLPFDQNGTSNAENAPWIWSGGSYSGALGAWVESLAPGTFWATHSSSGPVQAIYDYWQYFYPIQDEFADSGLQGMPKNCSSDFSAIIDYVDRVFLHGSRKQKDDLKQLFGLQDVRHGDDAAAAISAPIWAWQSIQLYSGYSKFYQMCDAIEGVSPSTTVAEFSKRGVGLKKALPNYAKWYTTSYLPGLCASYGYEDWQDKNSVLCLDTYNASSPMFTDWTESNAFFRTWVWMTCNDPFFYYQTGAPWGRPTVFSRLADAQYYQRQCELFFPRQGPYTYASNRGKTAAALNAHTKGWHLYDTKRLMWVNGEFDPWRSASMASVFRTGGPVPSTPQAPSIVIPGARHCNDLRVNNAVNEDVKKTQEAIIKQMAKWANEFYGPGRGRRHLPLTDAKVR